MKTLITLLLLGLSTSLYAHETDSHYDRIHLSASAQQQIDNDTIIATLYAEEEGGEPAALADRVNRKISDAVDTIRRHADIKLQTGSYTTSPVYHKNKINRWRVRQTIRLESGNMMEVSALLGQLQQQLALQAMQFAVSPELKNRTIDALISKALAAFDARAKAVVKQLGRKAYKIVDLNIATPAGARPYAMMARGVMMDASVAAPVVEAGEQTIQLTVNGEIELE